jgi:ubiquinone/menaquinone biosynthesis C-methylase UbiE
MALCRERVDAGEWIDGAEISPECVRDTLRDQAWINRWLGGADAVLSHALPVLRKCASAPVRVLDLACGGADISRRLVDEARRSGRAVEVMALDRSAPVLACARHACRDYPETCLVQGDALLPPFEEKAFDLVMLTTFLHHLQPEEVVAALRAARAMSRGAVIAVDLVRSPVALAAFSLLAPMAGFHPVSRHDGAVSLRRSYTPEELAGLARRAGYDSFKIHRHRFYRMALVYEGGEGGRHD